MCIRDRGRAALENLKSDKATLDKIRQLPKQRRDAIMAMIERQEKQIDRVGSRAYRKAMKELAESKGKYFREGGARKTTKPKASKLFSGDIKENLVNFITTDSGGLLDIAKTQLSKPGVAAKFAKEQGIQSDDIGSLTEYLEKAFKNPSIQSDALSEAGKIFAQGGISEQDAVTRAMFTIIKKYRYSPETGFLMFGDPEKFTRIR